jgi:hypothetical protein
LISGAWIPSPFNKRRRARQPRAGSNNMIPDYS